MSGHAHPDELTEQQRHEAGLCYPRTCIVCVEAQGKTHKRKCQWWRDGRVCTCSNPSVDIPAARAEGYAAGVAAEKEARRQRMADEEMSTTADLSDPRDAALRLAEEALDRLAWWPESTPEHPSITSQDVAMRVFAAGALAALHEARR